MELKNILEAVLFSSSRPVNARQISKKLEEFSVHDIENGFKLLIADFQGPERSVEIVEVAGGYQMRTKVEYRDFVKRFVKEKDVGLSRSMLETLSIIAYKQPVTKKDIDAVRGVDSARAIKHLLTRRFIEIAGRNGDAGKKIAFRTTAKFLEVYGLKTLDDLPTYKEIESLEG
ncbi:MAG: SMC-Scp complex subunit ScpB [Syntrophorhabdus sp.]